VPDVPWTTRSEMDQAERYLVMASHLPLKKLTSTVTFFRAVSAIRKQLAGADGLVGYTLRAKPMAREYWTLSVWRDEPALRLFMEAPPHVGLMASLQPLMRSTRFVQWEIAGSDGRPSWESALDHLTGA
jgi:hypothetical protein